MSQHDDADRHAELFRLLDAGESDPFVPARDGETAETGHRNVRR